MDRLSTVSQRRPGGLPRAAVVVACMLATAACGSEKSETAPPPGRVVAVKAKPGAKTAETAAEFCDVEDMSGQKKLTLPELDSPPQPAPNRPRWINLWATWCKPCIAEMPMLVKWRDRLSQEGIPVSLEFLSVDEEAEALGEFLKANAYLKSTLHLKDPESLAPWLQQLGLDAGAGLPIHIFTDAGDNIRCIRAAAISESHYATIAKLLKSPAQ